MLLGKHPVAVFGSASGDDEFTSSTICSNVSDELMLSYSTITLSIVLGCREFIYQSLQVFKEWTGHLLFVWGVLNKCTYCGLYSIKPLQWLQHLHNNLFLYQGQIGEKVNRPQLRKLGPSFPSIPHLLPWKRHTLCWTASLTCSQMAQRSARSRLGTKPQKWHIHCKNYSGRAIRDRTSQKF